MSSVSNVQFSRFTESEVLKLFTFGGKGALEVVWPASDDERRDLEAHLKEVFGVSLAVQVKARHVLVRRNRVSQPAEAADRVIRVLRAHSRRGRLQAVPHRITAPDASDVLWVGRPAA